MGPLMNRHGAVAPEIGLHSVPCDVCESVNEITSSFPVSCGTQLELDNFLIKRAVETRRGDREELKLCEN
jgi:hypothetical protein